MKPEAFTKLEKIVALQAARARQDVLRADQRVAVLSKAIGELARPRFTNAQDAIARAAWSEWKAVEMKRLNSALLDAKVKQESARLKASQCVGRELALEHLKTGRGKSEVA